MVFVGMNAINIKIMATRKKLIQLSKTANILSSYKYVLFVQSALDKRNIQSSLKNIADVRIFKCKNNTVQKAISQFIITNNVCNKSYVEEISTSLNFKKDFHNVVMNTKQSNKKLVQFCNVFQGPNCIIAGNDLQQLPLVWKMLNTVPHLFFCGAIIEQALADHLDLEQAVLNVYNVPKEVVYHRFLATLNPIDNFTSILHTNTYSFISTLSNLSEK